MNSFEYGSWKTKTHISLNGDATSFYIWIRDEGEHGEASEWIKGRDAFRDYHRLACLHKNRNEFIAECRILWNKNRKK